MKQKKGKKGDCNSAKRLGDINNTKRFICEQSYYAHCKIGRKKSKKKVEEKKKNSHLIKNSLKKRSWGR